nr:transporter substrate-binding domain-containing protein [uncultured Desulfobacter sp.]
MNKSLTSILVFLLFVLCFVPIAFSKNQIVKVGVYDNAPIVYMDENGDFAGLSVDVLAYIADKENWTLEYKFGTWSECINRLENSEIDIQVYIAFSEARALRYDYNNEMLISNWGGVYTRKGSDIKTIFDLKGKRVALLKKAIHPPAFRKMISSFDIKIDEIEIEIENHNIGFALVQEKKADAIVANRIFGLANYKQYDLEKTNIIFNPIEIRYASPKGTNANTLKSIDKHLKILKSDSNSIFYQSFNTAFGLNKSSNPISRWFYWGIIISFSLIVFLFIFTIILNYRVKTKTYELKNEVTERIKKEKSLKESELALKKSEERFKAIYENAPVLINAFDENGHCLLWNNECRKTFGWTIEEINTHGDALSLFYPDPEVRDEVIRTVTTDPDAHFREWYPVTKAGKTLDTMWANFTLPDGLTFNLGYDITERNKAENEKQVLQEKLHQSRKMESIGQLAGGIAHDFNNILYPIIAFSQLSQRDLPEDHPVQENLQDILDGAKRAEDLVKRILLFARQKERKLETMILQPIIKESYKLLRSSIPANINLILDLYTGEDFVLCDATEIHEIIINLCTNAYHAIIKHEGEIVVGLKKENPAPEMDLPPGEYLCLSVKDNGGGIPDEVKDKIFEPYVTTKEIGKGSGLGLSVVYGIVESYKGKINIDSSPVHGTEFIIFLPISKAAPMVQNIHDKESLKKGDERILFVDDEPSITKLATQALERCGYLVTAVNESKIALSLFQSTPDDFDLVITDMAMPGMVGTELSKKILEIRPDIKIMICSGFSDRLEKEKLKDFGVVAFLDKPLSIDVLAKVTRDVLDNKDLLSIA